MCGVCYSTAKFEVACSGGGAPAVCCPPPAAAMPRSSRILLVTFLSHSRRPVPACAGGAASQLALTRSRMPLLARTQYQRPRCCRLDRLFCGSLRPASPRDKRQPTDVRLAPRSPPRGRDRPRGPQIGPQTESACLRASCSSPTFMPATLDVWNLFETYPPRVLISAV